MLPVFREISIGQGCKCIFILFLRYWFEGHKVAIK